MNPHETAADRTARYLREAPELQPIRDAWAEVEAADAAQDAARDAAAYARKRYLEAVARWSDLSDRVSEKALEELER